MNHQKPISLQDQSSAPEWTCHTCGGDVLFCACPRGVASHDADAVLLGYFRGGPDGSALEPIPGASWEMIARCAYAMAYGRASHPPAVSGGGEVKRLVEAAEAFRAIALDALACWQVEDETPDDKQKRTRSAQSRTLLRHRLHSANGMLRASTPTPGAPR